MRIAILASLLLLTATVPATAQVSIGITIGSYPNFMAVPGYPVYYAPDVGANFFFYDGYYWVYQNDYWYSSTWYNGPWEMIDPMYVPIFVLQVPVRYYQRPPQYFRGWQSDRAPRWNDHWGRDWAQRRGDWDRPQRSSYAAPAPLPDYQRQYSGKDYPRGDQQRTLQQQNYHYHSQSAADRPNPGRQPDSRRSEAALPGNSERPKYDSDEAKRDQPRPTPRQEQQARPTPQRQQEQPRPTAQPEQQRAPVVHESDRGGAGVEGRRPSEPARDPQQKPQGDQHPDKAKNQDKGKNEDKDHRGD
jgi:hypothetical protein